MPNVTLYDSAGWVKASKTVPVRRFRRSLFPVPTKRLFHSTLINSSRTELIAHFSN
ncbi:hypothetical protein [Microcystis sp. LSC13-02]|uniref:hypothetical protein n=1 Tax=Microcystis sp. LSC13-02 TaxID=1895004 RepID=UPI00257F7D7D|nr:hypothetical protein [Microcystis sp. LSC13-02]